MLATSNVSTFTNNDVAPGAVVQASDHNSQGAALAAVINGGLDNANLAAGAAIAGSKLADDGVTDTKLDYPRWWQEIGRTTLTPAGDTISVASLPSRKYIRVIATLLATGGTITPKLVLNNDTTTANYNRRTSDNFGAGAASAGADLFLTDAAAAQTQYLVVDIVNVATQNKLIISTGMTDGGDGAAPATRKLIGQWEDSTNIISRIDLVNGGTGDFAIGSEVVILGHD